MKKIRWLLVITLTVAIIVALGHSVSAGESSSTARTVLAQYDFTEVSFSYGTGDSGTDSTGFVYNDGLLFLDNSTRSPELAKASVGLAAAVYKWDYVNSALSQMPGYSFDEYKTGASSRKGNWDKDHSVEDNDFVRYVIATKNATYNGENYIIYCVPIQGTTSGLRLE